VIAEAQRRGGICAFIDAEHSMDPQYARKIGVNVDDLLVSQPDTGEQALEITELLVRSGALDVVAVDSVAALTPKAEIEGEMGDTHVGLQARLMSQALRKLAGTLNRTDTICLFTNQLREKIGVMFGSPETTSGGRALKFYSSVRLDIRRIETLIRSNGVDVVIIDSVAALVPRAEIEGEMGDSFVGLQARLMSQALRKLTGAINRSNTALIFTNQLREKIGVMFGNPETTPGGRALKFYCSVRLDIRRIETLKSGTDAIGSRTRVKVVKNKVASPFRLAEFDIMYNEGISREGGLLDVGIAAGILSKTGAWFNYGETRLGQGRENSRDFLKAHPELADRVESEIRGKVATIEVGVEGIPEAE
jgi:RecA/RadA recombinase